MLKLRTIAMCSSYMFIRRKIKQRKITQAIEKKKSLAVTTGWVRFFETRLKAALRGARVAVGGRGRLIGMKSSVRGFAYSAG